MDKYRVGLTAEERAGLERLVSAGKAAARKLTHARILLLADVSLGSSGPMTRSSPPWASAPGPSPGSANASSPKAWAPPSIERASRHARPRSRSRATSSSN